MNKIFTFWEGAMPDYIKLCLKTWGFEYIVLNYSNLNDYTDLRVDMIRNFTLPQISDIVRVHVLRDNGGYWMDADTIMIGDKLPTENMVGIPENRNAHCGYLNFEENDLMLIKWAEHQDAVIRSNLLHVDWDVFANRFSDRYIENNDRITICPRRKFFPESYMVSKNLLSKEQYIKFYFEEKYHLSDIEPTEMLMLHNSWTPPWFKLLSESAVLANDCTMSNILREVTQ